MVSQKPSVLIVDDAQVVCRILSDELSERGYLCTTAYNGSEALNKLATEDFEVVLLDIRLPDMSGIEVLARIRSNHPDTETIVITVVSDVDTAVEAMKLGALDYVVKPFNLDRLDKGIRTVLETKQRTDEFPARMDAIARGVEARLDSLLGYSKVVAQETIDIAGQLGIPEEEIQQWVAIRARQNARRNAAIESSLNKLERNPLAQKMMGIAVPYLFTPKSDKSQN